MSTIASRLDPATRQRLLERLDELKAVAPDARGRRAETTTAAATAGGYGSTTGGFAMTQPVTNPAMTEDWLPDPPAISAVIHRDPCEHCGENAFGWASLDERADECHGQVVSRIAEYHRDDCSLSANGSYIVATVPVSQVQVAGEMLGDPDSR